MEKQELLARTLDDLGKQYPVGLYEYLYKQRQDLYSQLLDLEEKIDRAFLSGTIDDLKSGLREYWTFHIHAIREFKRQEHLTLNFSQARQEMAEERVKA
jgi:hypothetical protein